MQNFVVPSMFFDESPLQPVWMILLEYRIYLTSPLLPILLAIVSYFASTVPFTLMDTVGARVSWIRQYKVAPNEDLNWPQVRKCIALTAWNQLLYIRPITMAQCVWTPAVQLPASAPGVWEFVWHQFLAFALFDFEFYLWHALHHRCRWLYRNVHAAVNCWLGQYIHPFELISFGILGTTVPLIVGCHPLTLWSFMTYLQYISVESHSGYDLPWSLQNWVPFWSGAVKHDMRHRRPLTNFQPFFNWFDRLAGSECPGQTAGGRKPKALLEWERNEAKIEKDLNEEEYADQSKAI